MTIEPRSDDADCCPRKTLIFDEKDKTLHPSPSEY